jgi:hypothetical protein
MELERRTPIKPIRVFRAVAAGVNIAGMAVNEHPKAQEQQQNQQNQQSPASTFHTTTSTSHTTDIQPHVQISYGPESHDSQHPQRRDLEKRYWGELEERR